MRLLLGFHIRLGGYSDIAVVSSIYKVHKFSQPSTKCSAYGGLEAPVVTAKNCAVKTYA
jgi:hypothetical protein